MLNCTNLYNDPYLGRFAQPDTIIPINQGVQAWDRYAYTNNNPLRYNDPTGHFTCQTDDHTTFSGDCKAAIEAYLTLLETKGGEEGQALVEAFREADTVTRCGRGGCHELKDQIAITISEEIYAQYGTNGTDTFTLSPAMLKEDELIGAVVFGHEIQHQVQDHDPLKENTGPGSLYGELDAYIVEQKLQENMRIAGKADNPRAWVAEIAAYEGAAARDILGSPWATVGEGCEYYRCMPLYSNSFRPFDNLWYLRWRRP